MYDLIFSKSGKCVCVCVCVREKERERERDEMRSREVGGRWNVLIIVV